MKILIADEEPAARAWIRNAFHARGGVDTIWEVEDGEEAVFFSRNLHPDLVLMALAMPRIDGLEATRLIKEKNPEIQVIVLSDLSDTVYRRAALQCGADGFIPIPSPPKGPRNPEGGPQPRRPAGPDGMMAGRSLSWERGGLTEAERDHRRVGKREH